MELLKHTRTRSKHARRHSDHVSAVDNRLLVWGSRDSDISLQSHSPPSLVQILTQNGGFLELSPQNLAPENGQTQDEENAGTQRSSTLAASERKPISAGNDRLYLATQHTKSELSRQCKKILVENALIKRKGDRQLYLAAGFISWPDAASPDTRHRAPLLLYPALLVRIADEQKYEIRLTGITPEFNCALAQHIEQRHDCTLPAYSEESSLIDFFAMTAQSIGNSCDLEFDQDVALGNASLLNEESGFRDIPLPEIPEQFDVALAMNITGKKNLDHLDALLQLIPDFSRGLANDKKPKQPGNEASNSTAQLRRYAAKLAADGLDHIEFRRLPSLPSRIKLWQEQIPKALNSKTLREVLKAPDLSARDLVKLGGIIELIDKAPDNIDSWAHGDLCFASSTALLRRAQHQARLIEEELQALKEQFLLEKVPTESQLLSLISELSRHSGSEPDLVNKKYFNARRQFMEFSISKPANLTAEHRQALSQLAKVMRFRGLYVNNVEYRAALGPGYRGLRTDWATLVQGSEYARKLAEVLGSESLAAAMVDNWHAFRKSYSRELEKFQHAAEGTRGMLTVAGKRWQSRPVTALAAHVETTANHLDEWRGEYGTFESHGEKTAAVVLSSFSGQSMDHVLVETQLDETIVRIRQQLRSGEINIEQINDTLSWLSSAIATTRDNELDVDAIVEYLHSA